jgi:acyl-coenzyme A thioesterase PaaI-like protein
MTTLAHPVKNRALQLWRALNRLPMGAWIFSRFLCIKAPYFSSISPLFEVLESGQCKVSMKNRRAVHNHIGTVHAIAMCNMAELAAGTMVEVSIPPTHRWIPKGMSVQYLKKAETNLLATAQFAQHPTYGAAQSALVNVIVTDTAGQQVFTAQIDIWIAPKKS